MWCPVWPSCIFPVRLISPDGHSRYLEDEIFIFVGKTAMKMIINGTENTHIGRPTTKIPSAIVVVLVTQIQKSLPSLNW